MNIVQTTHVSKSPFIMPLYIKALCHAVIKAIIKPRINNLISEQYCINALSINLRHLQQYIKCCGFNHTGYLPITYPFVIAFPLLMKLMTSTKFPVSILGLIHYKNQIIQHYPIKQNAILTVTCRVKQDHTSNRGRFIQVHIDIFEDKKLMWECTATFLHKCQKKQYLDNSHNSNTAFSSHDEQMIEIMPPFTFSKFNALRYAYISRDINPIHLHYIPAKLMGFKSSILHGMFAKAHVLANLENVIDIQRISIDVQFNNAIFLPGEVSLNAALSPQNSTFKLINSEKRMTHLSGVILPLINRMN
ncbi:hypothetical protein HWV00_09510 [Moritella sp. 24]|nr:hypothetical protein HWV00_09510 [Moritella sp. 24]